MIIVLVALFPLTGYGQLGGNIKYLNGQSDILEQVNISQDGLQLSVEYGFRLKQKRLEFHPGIGYRFAFKGAGDEGSISAFDMDLNTAIYPFDFGGDCDCPTFSKEGNLIKKGLFVEVSPGMSFQTLNRDEVPLQNPDEPTSYSVSNSIFKYTFAMGLDIGISESFTLTPMVSYSGFSSVEWLGLNPDGSEGILDDQSFLGLGFRMVYKPNPKRLRRR